MGYDMRWVDGPDPDEVESGRWRSNPGGGDRMDEYEGGSDRWREAQRLIFDLSDEISRAERSYFHLNIWGMGRYRDAMEPLGMVHWLGKDGKPPWPSPEDFGFTWAEIDDPEESDDPRAAAYVKAQDEVLRYAPEMPGISGWKLCSNDGWIVTPIECLTAVRAWEDAERPNPIDNEPDYWLRWVAFIAEAAVHGGFEVH